jgi:hypothetical protein
MEKGLVSTIITTFDRKYLPQHAPPPDFREFLDSLSQAERQLHELAMKPEGLGSSYFMEKSHHYCRWKSEREKSEREKSEREKEKSEQEKKLTQ